jgi:hypothetical protein
VCLSHPKPGATLGLYTNTEASRGETKNTKIKAKNNRKKKNTRERERERERERRGKSMKSSELMDDKRDGPA